jgi:deoxyribonuclease-4
MSVQGGLPCALDRAREVGATALQVFVKSARRWAAPPPSREEADRFREGLATDGLERHTLAHASYLINLASPDESILRRSVEALSDEVERCALFGIPYLVLHPGSHVGSGEQAGLKRIAKSLDRVLGRRSSHGEVVVLLENTAGQGSNLGHRFEQLGQLLERTAAADRVGVCFDTCHALAAGYELDSARSYRSTMDELDRTVGLSRVLAFHLNDSKFDVGSRKDRHEHIGQGFVGLDGFRRILRDRRFDDVPMVLETPKEVEFDDDRRNLATLRSLRKQGRRSR